MADVRKPEPHKLEEIARLIWAEVYDELAPADISEWLEKCWPPSFHNQWFIIEVSGELAGAICWSLYDRYGRDVIFTISWLAVSTKWQNQGLGKLLWRTSQERVEDELKRRELNLNLIFVQVDEDNQRAYSFYKNIFGEYEEIRITNVWAKEVGIRFLFKKV